ncbi:MAG: o-succinylbenzoate--CoA ligase [Rubricoccaceae bacterium]
MTLPDPVRQWAEHQSDAPALVTPTNVWTWADLDARVDACACQFERLDSHRVGVRAETQPALVVLVLAALRARRVLVPLSTRWPRPMLTRAMTRLGLASLIAEDEIEDVDTISLHEITQPDGVLREWEPLHLDASFTLIHTSGSTGEPKAALHTVGNHVASAEGLIQRFLLGPGDRWLLNLPLYHVGGLAVVFRCALAGATMVLPEPAMSTAEAVRQLQPTHASLVSTQLIRLLEENVALASLQLVLLGGSAFPSGVLDAAEALGLPIVMSYGMTEMTSTITSSSLPVERNALATSGTVLPRRELRISDVGEIDVRGPTLFSGYVEGDGLRRPVDAEGWFATGDRGTIDADGRLIVHGRVGNGFVSGGENIQPEAIEAALAALRGVARAVVVPVPDAEFGARPVAFVQSTGTAIQANELANALRATLPGFMVPVAFLQWDGPSGLKPDRTALAEVASSTLENPQGG